MNLSAEFLGMLERALQDRYDAGYKEGLDYTSAAADEAHAQGYAQAMHEVANWANAKTSGREPPFFDTHDEHEELEEPEEPTQTPHLSPAKAKIVDFVGGNPGVTAAEVQRACGGSNSTVYSLTKFGLLAKKGRQFYPNPFYPNPFVAGS